MSEKSSDRRTLKTRKALRNGLAELLAEKELHKVTVQEIADKADVNRVTFYKHYLDVYDLYDKTEQEVLVELGLLALRLGEVESGKFFSNLIDYIDENRTLFRMIFSPNTTGKLREKFSRCLEGMFRKIEAEQCDLSLSDGKLCYQSCYRAQGCIAIIAKWVLGNFTEPKEFIVKTASELDGNTEKLIRSVGAARK